MIRDDRIPAIAISLLIATAALQAGWYLAGFIDDKRSKGNDLLSDLDCILGRR